MKILITGGSGLLGKYLHLTEPEGAEVEYTWYSTHQPWCAHRLDVADQAQVDYVFGKVKPQIVIHMAGIGNVDFCQDNYQIAWQANTEGTRHVMRTAMYYDAQVLLTSTNAVFSGEDPPYGEEDERRPVNAYGQIRKAAEDVALRHDGWVVRLFLLYGWEPDGARGNWASGGLKMLQAGKRLRMVNDRWYMPTYAEDAARAVWALLDQGQGRGLKDLGSRVYHVAGESCVTLYTFLRAVAEQWGLDPSLVEPCSFDELKGLAPRPRDTAYRLDRAAELGIACLGIREGLSLMYEEWLEGAGGGPG